VAAVEEAWTAGDTVIVEGVTFHQYHCGSRWLRVQDGVTVTQP